MGSRSVEKAFLKSVSYSAGRRAVGRHRDP